MKTNYQNWMRFLGVLLSVTIFGSQLGCGATQRYSAADSRMGQHAGLPFEPEYYLLHLKNGKKTKVAGRSIEERAGVIVVRSKDGAVVSTYPRDRVKKIFVVGGREGTHALKGMGWGALGGLVVGGAIAGAAAARSCEGSGDPGDCRNINRFTMMLAPTGLPIVSGLFGLVFGAVMPKKRKVEVLPPVETVSTNDPIR